MKNCEYCKAAMPDDAIKCPACGAYVKDRSPETEVAVDTSRMELSEKERMTKKQTGLFIASCIITFIALVIEIYAAVIFGSTFASIEEDTLGTAAVLVIFLPLWLMFGCTTSGIAIIYNLCVMRPLGKKWFIPLILAALVAVAVCVVIAQIFFINSSSSSEAAFALLGVL